jgi:hypothetical protein
VLDWDPVTMRLTVLRQMIKGAWADAVTVEAQAAALARPSVSRVTPLLR